MTTATLLVLVITTIIASTCSGQTITSSSTSGPLIAQFEFHTNLSLVTAYMNQEHEIPENKRGIQEDGETVITKSAVSGQIIRGNFLVNFTHWEGNFLHIITEFTPASAHIDLSVMYDLGTYSVGVEVSDLVSGVERVVDVTNTLVYGRPVYILSTNYASEPVLMTMLTLGISGTSITSDDSTSKVMTITCPIKKAIPQAQQINGIAKFQINQGSYMTVAYNSVNREYDKLDFGFQWADSELLQYPNVRSGSLSGLSILQLGAPAMFGLININNGYTVQLKNVSFTIFGRSYPPAPQPPGPTPMPIYGGGGHVVTVYVWVVGVAVILTLAGMIAILVYIAKRQRNKKLKQYTPVTVN